MGLSQEALASKVKVHRKTISRWETGGTGREPSLRQLLRLAEILRVSGRWLIGDKEDHSPPFYPRAVDLPYFELYIGMDEAGKEALRSMVVEASEAIARARRRR